MERAKEALVEIRRNLEEGIIPFWVEKGVDKEYGGYLTCFDVHGNLGADTDKYIVTQARMIWGLSALCEEYGEERLRRAAQQGYGFFCAAFLGCGKGRVVLENRARRFSAGWREGCIWRGVRHLCVGGVWKGIWR